MDRRTAVDAELDDLLETAALVQDDRRLTDRVFDRVVDLLLESTVVDIDAAAAAGRITERQRDAGLLYLAERALAVGLIPTRS